jgi:hypothetical protein
VIRARVRGETAEAVREQAAAEGCTYGDVIAGWRTSLAEALVTAAGLRGRLDEAIAERDEARLEAMALTSRLAAAETERDEARLEPSRRLAAAEAARGVAERREAEALAMRDAAVTQRDRALVDAEEFAAECSLWRQERDAALARLRDLDVALTGAVIGTAFACAAVIAALALRWLGAV